MSSNQWTKSRLISAERKHHRRSNNCHPTSPASYVRWFHDWVTMESHPPSCTKRVRSKEGTNKQRRCKACSQRQKTHFFVRDFVAPTSFYQFHVALVCRVDMTDCWVNASHTTIPCGINVRLKGGKWMSHDAGTIFPRIRVCKFCPLPRLGNSWYVFFFFFFLFLRSVCRVEFTLSCEC